MATRVPAHQLSNGLYVSCRPDQQQHPKDKTPTMSSLSIPYTGGDIKDSGDLVKMFDTTPSKPSRPNSGPINRSTPNSGSIAKKPTLSGSGSGSGLKSGSGSGSVVLQPTGLITSGPLSGDQRVRRSGPIDGKKKKSVLGVSNGTHLVGEVGFGYKVPIAVIWGLVLVLIVGVLGGCFVMVMMKSDMVLVVAVGLLVLVLVVVVWNCVWKRKGVLGFVDGFADAELRSAADGQYVKVTGVVTCGSSSLETPYQRVPRCVYTSAELLEYRGWGDKSAHPKHRAFSWGSRYSERYVADFYISDFQSGLRALVKASHGGKVAVFVDTTTVVDVSKDHRDLPQNFLQWLSNHNLSSDDRIMRLKEGYIKEGSTVSVMGTVKRQDNVLMIIPPSEPISTGCQWLQCLFPRRIENLILKCDDNQVDVIPV